MLSSQAAKAIMRLTQHFRLSCRQRICKVCKAHWGKLWFVMIQGYINTIDLTKLMLTAEDLILPGCTCEFSDSGPFLYDLYLQSCHTYSNSWQELNQKRVNMLSALEYRKLYRSKFNRPLKRVTGWKDLILSLLYFWYCSKGSSANTF